MTLTKARFMVSTLPASVPSAKAAVPSLTKTCWPPSVYSPSGMAAPSMASVIRTAPDAPFAATMSLTMSGSKWTPSAMISQTTSGWARTAPTVPGSRWCSPRMALKVWVACVAPHAIAVSTSAAFASVWPTETMMPLARACRMISSAPGTSGASVICRIVPPDSAIQCLSSSPSGGRTNASGCAPRRAAQRYGPSR